MDAAIARTVASIIRTNSALSAAEDVRNRLLCDIAIDLTHDFFEDVEHGVDFVTGYVQSAETAHDRTVSSAFFHHELILETTVLDTGGDIAAQMIAESERRRAAKMAQARAKKMEKGDNEL